LRRFLLLCLPLFVLFAVSTTTHAELIYDTSHIALYSADAEPGSSNSHPITLEADQISAALSRVRARSGETGKIIDLFPEKNRKEAAKVLAKQLSKIKPGQDLHLISFRKVGRFFSSSRNATSARVFVENGQLNLIFGQIDRFHSEFRDPGKLPPPMGSRKQPAALKGSILPAPGITFVNGRTDWVALDLSRTVSAPPAPAPSAIAPAATEGPVERTGEKYQKPALQPKVKRSLEERFKILKNLRDKGLITEQEYVDKKRELLDSL
jgi:Short C-terminal domain